jgi:hypothetical protein
VGDVTEPIWTGSQSPPDLPYGSVCRCGGGGGQRAGLGRRTERPANGNWRRGGCALEGGDQLSAGCSGERGAPDDVVGRCSTMRSFTHKPSWVAPVARRAGRGTASWWPGRRHDRGPGQIGGGDYIPPSSTGIHRAISESGAPPMAAVATTARHGEGPAGTPPHRGPSRPLTALSWASAAPACDRARYPTAALFFTALCFTFQAFSSPGVVGSRSGGQPVIVLVDAPPSLSGPQPAAPRASNGSASRAPPATRARRSSSRPAPRTCPPRRPSSFPPARRADDVTTMPQPSGDTVREATGSSRVPGQTSSCGDGTPPWQHRTTVRLGRGCVLMTPGLQTYCGRTS